MSKRDYAVILKKYSKVLNGEEIISPTTYAFPQNRIGVFIGKAETEKSYLLRSIGEYESFERGEIQIKNSYIQLLINLHSQVLLKKLAVISEDSIQKLHHLTIYL